jgi:ligand-binding sensor domain-containing protein/signal transduction histidine kinase
MRAGAVKALMILLLASRLFALSDDSPRGSRRYTHAAWRLSDATLRGYPRSLAQTIDGYLWLGTEYGLVRFDGLHFVPWIAPAGSALPSDIVTTLLAARDGSLWIGTTAGLAHWVGHSLIAEPLLAKSHISALTEDHAGAVWIGTSSGLSGEGKLCVVRSAVTTCRSESYGRFVISLHEGSPDELWVGAESGLWHLNRGVRDSQPVLGQATEIHGIVTDGSGTLVVALSREVRRIVGGASGPFLFPHAGRLVKPTALWRDRRGGVWIGTQHDGVIYTHDGVTTRFTRADGLSGDFVTALLEDREDNIWVATLNGLDRFRRLAISTITTKQGLSTDTVMSVFGSRDGSVWVGTVRGLNRWRNGVISQLSRHGGVEESVGSIFEDSLGRLWAAWRNSVAYTRRGAFSPPVVRDGYVHGFAESDSGDLWIAAQREGLYHLRDARVVEVVPWAALGDRHVRSMVVDPRDGSIWLGFFEGGIASFDGTRIRCVYTETDGLPRGAVNHVYLDAARALWISTDHGLGRLENGSVRTLTIDSGLPCDSVRWAIDDERQTLWLYTRCGIIRIPQSEVGPWASGRSRTVRVTTYDSADGVPANTELGLYGPKVTRARDGRVWFATYDGVGIIDPGNVPVNTLAPPVHIEQITTDRITREPLPNLVLPPSVRDLRIDYTGVSLGAPEKVRFRYKLEGRDREWVDARDRRQAFYSDLPPKAYRFRVIAGSGDNSWNTEAAVWSFSIRPAVYQTTAFSVAALLLLLTVIWSLHQLRVTVLAGRLSAKLEARMAERTRIAQELHDTLLQGSLSAAIQLTMIADEVKEPRLRSNLEHIVRRIREVSEESRRTVHALRVEQTAAEDLDRVLARDAERLREGRNIVISVVLEGRRRAIHPIVRDEVYRIAREALVNSFRHAAPTRMDIEVDYQPDHLRVSVRDDGRGIPAETLVAGRHGHWGITGMRERAERIGATLKVMIGTHSGTEVMLAVPAGIAFEQQKSLVVQWLRRARTRWYAIRGRRELTDDAHLGTPTQH